MMTGFMVENSNPFIMVGAREVMAFL